MEPNHFFSNRIVNLYEDNNPWSNRFSISRSAQARDIDQSFILTETSLESPHFAFGPEVSLSLQVVTFGDFCHDGWYAQTTAFLVKSAAQSGLGNDDVLGHYYCRLSFYDYEQRILIGKYYNSLAACPTSSLFANQ
jgi:hypothetical protein